MEWINGKRLWGKVIFSVINILVLIVVFVGTYCNPYRNSISMYANPDYYCKQYDTELTYEEAKADLDEAMQYLKNVHPMFIHGLTDDVQGLYQEALAHLQEEESISINDLCKEIEIIFSSLGDGHTHAGANYSDCYYLKYIYGHDVADGITYTYMDSDGDLFEETYYAEDFLTADEYKKCLADMFREVKEQGIDNVCVDLRKNGGGNSLVADEFIHYLDVDSYRTWGQDWRLGLFMISSEGKTLSNPQYTDLLFDGDVYVLTSTDSFSSAMDFAMLISDNKLGTIVGEPSGNKPRSYGDISIFKLGNSGLVMQVSTKKWYRVDETIADELIEPDIKCNSEEALQVLVEHLSE